MSINNKDTQLFFLKKNFSLHEKTLKFDKILAEMVTKVHP